MDFLKALEVYKERLPEILAQLGLRDNPDNDPEIEAENVRIIMKHQRKLTRMLNKIMEEE